MFYSFGIYPCCNASLSISNHIFFIRHFVHKAIKHENFITNIKVKDLRSNIKICRRSKVDRLIWSQTKNILKKGELYQMHFWNTSIFEWLIEQFFEWDSWYVIKIKLTEMKSWRIWMILTNRKYKNMCKF